MISPILTIIRIKIIWSAFWYNPAQRELLGGTILGTVTPDTYDSADQNGLYQVNGSSATNPILDWGRLFVVVQGVGHCLQIKYCANAKKIIIRYKYKTTSMSAAEWTAWSEVNVTALQ